MFHHNNNFNLISIYSAKTITIKYFKNYGSIYGVNKTIVWFQINFLYFKFIFFHNVAYANFFNALLGHDFFNALLRAWKRLSC